MRAQLQINQQYQERPRKESRIIINSVEGVGQGAEEVRIADDRAWRQMEAGSSISPACAVLTSGVPGSYIQRSPVHAAGAKPWTSTVTTGRMLGKPMALLQA